MILNYLRYRMKQNYLIGQIHLKHLLYLLNLTFRQYLN